MINRAKFNGLPKEQQAIIQYAAEAASSANEWRAYDQYS
jgi:TRAP-type mannitol/chloroaromatic compound transport system substrate-binding protein